MQAAEHRDPGGRTFSDSKARLKADSKFNTDRLKFGVSALAMLLAITFRRSTETSNPRLSRSMVFSKRPINIILIFSPILFL